MIVINLLSTVMIRVFYSGKKWKNTSYLFDLHAFIILKKPKIYDFSKRKLTLI